MRYLLSLTIISVLFSGCASGGGGVRVSPPLGAAPPSSSVQALFESGRDDEVVNRVAASARSEDVWYGAQSLLRKGQRAEAGGQFGRLRDTAESEAFRRAAEVALARVNGQPDAVAVAQGASGTFPNDPYVQFEVGVTRALAGDMAGAAQAFDAAINASPMLAYAYYQAGLAYSRLERQDLTVSRFEVFVRLAPSAPERSQVDAILRVARGVS